MSWIISRVSLHSLGLLTVWMVEDASEVRQVSSPLAFRSCRARYQDGAEVDAVVHASGEDSASLIYKYVIPPSDFPLISLHLEGDFSVALDVEKFLHEIFPVDDVSFSKMFMRRINRYGDTQTQYFIARQIDKYFTGSHAHRCSSAVVMAYKAIESLEPEFLQEALRSVDNRISDIALCDLRWHPRFNREHLHISLLCARWHLLLALGDKVGFLETLEFVQEFQSHLDNYFTKAYNISVSLLILCLFQKLRGDGDAVSQIVRAGIVLFQRAVADAMDEKTLFTELNISHRSVCLMLDLRAAKNIDQKMVAKVLDRSLRVSGTAAEFLKDKFNLFIDAD